MTNSIRPNQTFPSFPEPVDNNLNRPGSTPNAPEEGPSMQMEAGPSEPRIPQRSPLQIALLAQLPSHTSKSQEAKSKEAYFAEWEAWAQAPGQGIYEKRTEAVEKMKAWLEAGDPDAELNLSELTLTGSLPALPPSIRKLNVSSNYRLTSLPEPLPSSLQELDASLCQLTSLPPLPPSLRKLKVSSSDELTSLPEPLPSSLQELNVSRTGLASLPPLPPSLRKLEVSRNRLTSLGESLPRSLETLDASFNQLDHLPELPTSLKNLDVMRNRLISLPALPPSLREVKANDNRLTSLPEDFTTTLGRDCRIFLGNNPFSERVRQNLNRTMNIRGNQGPRIFFSMTIASEAGPARPLEEAVSGWCGKDMEEVKTAWSAFNNEEGAADFSRFLDRLRDTVNYANPQFRQSVADWLPHLASHPELRKNTFLVSAGATESCEDRVSLTYNEMKKVRVAFDVENGRYDDRLDELVKLSRGMFRLDHLEKIAREKVDSLSFVDEIEVYLAYQVKLRDQLQLPLDTPDMRFFGVSWVTADDLAKAEQHVKKTENQEFVHYLSTRWQPWQSVLSRLHGEQYEEAQDRLIDATGEPFEKELKARLERDNLENDADAQRIVGKQVMADIEREIKEPLTRECLNAHNLSHLLDPQWELDEMQQDESRPDAHASAEAGN